LTKQRHYLFSATAHHNLIVDSSVWSLKVVFATKKIDVIIIVAKPYSILAVRILSPCPRKFCASVMEARFEFQILALVTDTAL
jgi:UDP:flavonoid glycosyltransferase YjiC (YdhE family)